MSSESKKSNKKIKNIVDETLMPIEGTAVIDNIESDQHHLDPNLVYCGPSIKKYGILQYTTYKNGNLPAFLKKDMAEFSLLKKLFVESSKLGEFQKRLSEKQSSESAFFNAAKAYFEEVGK